MTWEPQKESDGSLVSASSAVQQAVGAASVCWENMENTGLFDDAKACEIAEGLLKFLHDRHGLLLPMSRPEGHGWKPLDDVRNG